MRVSEVVRGPIEQTRRRALAHWLAAATVAALALAAASHDVAPARAAPANVRAAQPTAQELARRYTDVGKALAAKQNVDDLRARYRRIDVTRALQSVDARAAAMHELDAIDRALATR